MQVVYSSEISDYFCELKYLHLIIQHLEEQLSDQWVLVIVNDRVRELPKTSTGQKIIVIMLSDELGIIPSWKDDADIVFRTFSRNSVCDYQKIFPIPSGFNGPLIGNSYVPEMSKKELIERPHDFFYSGKNIEKNRKRFFRKATKVTAEFTGFLNGTIGWQKGDNYINLDEYYKYMNTSKIAFAPSAVVTPETFRYYEGFESNCIVITDYPIHKKEFDLWYYKDSPAVFLKYWWQLNKKMLKKLLSQESLERYQELNKKYFEKALSSKAVAGYILEKVEKI